MQGRFRSKNSKQAKSFSCTSESKCVEIVSKGTPRVQLGKFKAAIVKPKVVKSQLQPATGRESLPTRKQELIDQALQKLGMSKEELQERLKPSSSKPKLVANHTVQPHTKFDVRQRDFLNGSYVISKPGLYKFCENVVYNAKKPGTPAIQVKPTEGVIIDLNGHSLKQSVSSNDDFDDISAIVVDRNVNDLVIKNGRIAGFSDQGIVLVSNLTSPMDHHNVLIEKIDFEDIGKIDTQPSELFGIRGAIAAHGTTDLTIRKCKAWNIAAAVDCEAFFTAICTNVVMEDLEIRDVNSDPDQGFSAGLSNYFYINVSYLNCRVQNAVAQSVFGILSYIGSYSSMRQCESIGNNSPSSDSNGVVLGIAVYLTGGFDIVDCTANDNVALGDVGESVNFTAGIQTAGASHGKILGCNAVGNNAVSQSSSIRCGAVGFDINGSDSIHLENCMSGGTFIQSARGGGIAAGFDCDRSNNITHENCVSKGEYIIGYTDNSQEGALSSKICGFYASIIPEGGSHGNIAYRNCTSISRYSDDPTVNVGGFFINEPIGSLDNPVTAHGIIIDHCIVEQCNNAAAPSKGFGIVFQADTSNSSVTNCEVNTCDQGIVINGRESMYNVVQGNRVLSSIDYGIRDTTGTNSNMFAQNYVYSPGGNNYDGLPASTPIREWSLSGGMSNLNSNGITDPLDNFDVTI